MKKQHSIPMLLMGMALCSGIQAQSLDATDLSRNNEEGVVKVNPRERAYRENQILVKFREGSPVRMKKAGKRMAATVSAVDALFAELGVESAEQLMPQTGGVMRSPMRKMKAINGAEMTEPDMSTLYKLDLSVSAVSVEEACAKFSALTSEVEFAEPNYLVYVLSVGTEDAVTYDDPLYNEQWGIPAINLDKLWSQPKINNKRPIIAILDTGVDITHPDLADNIWTNQAEAEGEEKMDDDANGFKDDIHGWDFVNQTANVRDNNGHGTHCAGIAGAVGGNGIGIVGANPDAYIMPVTVMQSDGTGDIATIIKGVDYAVANGADILSMSLGTYSSSVAMEQSLGKAYASTILVAAAGNEHRSIKKYPCFPAAYTFVLGVQAQPSHFLCITHNLKHEGYSNYDEDGQFFSSYDEEKQYNYELSAPGSNVISTYPKGQYKVLSGTSMACPIVAASISRLIQSKEYPSKEILFYDLISTSGMQFLPWAGPMNIFEAFKVDDSSRKPLISLISYEINDEELGDGDGNIDAGETISIYPTIKNFGADTKDVKLSIELAENEDPSIAKILTKTAILGYNLSAYSKARSENPLIIQINKDCVDGRHISLKLTVSCENADPVETDVVITVNNSIEIGGLIKEDTTLYPDVQYVVTSDLAVPSGVTLTILPGAIIKIRGSRAICCEGTLVCEGTPDNMILFTSADLDTKSELSLDFKDVIKYSKFYNLSLLLPSPFFSTSSKLNNCEIKNCFVVGSYNEIYTSFENCNVIECQSSRWPFTALFEETVSETNVIGNELPMGITSVGTANKQNKLNASNVFNNFYRDGTLLNYKASSTGIQNRLLEACYWGSSNTDIISRGISTSSFCYIDYSDILTQPSSNAHGIVWKVVVNGKDAQDEFEELAPLGVGRHKFEVYFNRPMDKSVAPSISMGVRPPYTQTVIAEDGEWNEEGDIYTAYLTITGKSSFDGLNRIRVYGAQDDEFFEIPEEYYRFNVMVQKAGSMSTGLMAEPGLGKVNLTWETAEEDFADLMGYNVYRTQENSSDTIKVNDVLIDATETAFTDYDVVPGTTYYYMVKEMGTDLQQHDISNVVAATPLTASKGDANGSMSVDIADVVTEIAYLTNQNPQPFIFEAADVNEDQSVDILDVVGTLNIIITPSDAAIAGINEEPAIYSIEDGILYVETPVTLGGIQAIVNIEREGAEISTLDDLKGFEQTSAWLSNDQYIFLAYSMSGKALAPGKHALLRVGNAANVDLVLSDVKGKNVETVNGNSTRLTGVSRDAKEGSKVVVTDLTGRVLSDKNLTKGFYLFSTYSANGQLIQTEKVVLE